MIWCVVTLIFTCVLLEFVVLTAKLKNTSEKRYNTLPTCYIARATARWKCVVQRFSDVFFTADNTKQQNETPKQLHFISRLSMRNIETVNNEKKR